MSEAEFWQATPRKLFALAEVHIRVHSSKGESGKPPERLSVKEFARW